MIYGFTGLCALAALIELDTVYVGQFLISRPAIAGTILGWAAGDTLAGFQLGLFAELLLLDHVPVGGNVPPSGVYWAASAILLYFYYALPIEFAFILGMPVGRMYSYVETALRHSRSFWNKKIEQAIEREGNCLGKWVAKSILMQFAAGTAFVFLSTVAMGFAGRTIWEIMSPAGRAAVRFGYTAVPWIGLAMLLSNLNVRAKAKQQS